MIALRQAALSDLDAIMVMIGDAKSLLKSQNSTQWQDGYPADADIEQDIKNENGWVLTVDGIPAAYLAATDFDENYLTISWDCAGPYWALHRFAVSQAFRGQGLAQQLITLVMEEGQRQGVKAFRLDTGFENHVIQHLAGKLGFQERGVITVKSDSHDPRRLAYELVL
ncbi:GNAT family N-acetyltransferase [Lactobacillus sp.]|uniref:GNAT family N-acetyltransferase n=1 Tax=Lactobacillus sp. TaxID=1591 RepID=UPI003EF74FB5